MAYDVQCKYQYMFCATFYKLNPYVTANSQKNILANYGQY